MRFDLAISILEGFARIRGTPYTQYTDSHLRCGHQSGLFYFFIRSNFDKKAIYKTTAPVPAILLPENNFTVTPITWILGRLSHDTKF